MRRTTAIINIVWLVFCGMLLMQGIQEASGFKFAIGMLCLIANVAILTRYLEK